MNIVVADDGSADNSENIVREFAPTVRWLSCPDFAPHGCGAARNRAIEATDAKYLALLDADDIWFSGHVSSLIAAMEAHPAVAMACDNGRYIDESDRVFGTIMPADCHFRLDATGMLLNCFTDPSAVIIRRTALDDVGAFAQTRDLLYVEDHDMWLRLLERFAGLYLPVHGYAYRIHAGQVSCNPIMWRNAFNVLSDATKRHPYSKSAIRKRRAVLLYRTSEVALRENRWLVSIWNLAGAVVLDPLRAILELFYRITTPIRRHPRTFRREDESF